MADIKLEPDERPEDLYQRLVAFVEDNLLLANSLTHSDGKLSEDEDISPTLENVIVLVWLRTIHPNLPKLVKQKYGTELRTQTLTSIKPEISMALDSLLDELNSTEDARVMRSVMRKSPFSNSSRDKSTVPKRGPISCALCQQAKRKSDHFLSKCMFLPDSDKRYFAKTRLVAAQEDETESDSEFDQSSVSRLSISEPQTRRVQVRQSPYLDTYYKHHPIRLTIDSGAETNLINVSLTKLIGTPVSPSNQTAMQADGRTPLKICGETSLTLIRDGMELHLKALVVDGIDVDILAGVPFMTTNDISVRPAKLQVLIGAHKICKYTSCDPSRSSAVRNIFTLRAPSSPTTVWPGDYVEISMPPDISPDSCDIAIEPRADASPTTPVYQKVWPEPAVIRNVGEKIRIPNNTGEPIILKRNQHFGQALLTSCPNSTNDPIIDSKPLINVQPSPHVGVSQIKVDPDHMLPDTIVNDFHSTHEQLSKAFDSSSRHPYNGASGPFKHVINMGSTQPPPRRGRIPQYSRDKLEDLQLEFDRLTERGVFSRPEDLGISVEYVNPSFLVKKPNGGHRLVTAFGDVGRYAKIQPTALPDVDSTLRTIAGWKHLIITDLSSAYFQIPLHKDSMKYCGVVTPFKGTLVYTRSAMGMPGSEVALEELMCRILGDLIQEGIIAKICDDLYVGGDTPGELLTNWTRVLETLIKNGVYLSAPKTIVNPRSAIILGWVWSLGTITASPHRISTLSSCTRPVTVKDMRSFLGAYKILSRVIPDCAGFLSPLEESVAGKSSPDVILWSDTLISMFDVAQKNLANNRTITLPLSEDQLWIVTDGSVKQRGIGATMFAMRHSKLHLCGFFSAKLRKHQVTWLPCEIEALGIGAAVKHFSPYIIRSSQQTHILTDSKPCVQGFEKLCRGEFSNSPRITSFLSTVSRYQVLIQHLAGEANTPADFSSRNAPECTHPRCQICTFITSMEDSVVRSLSVSDIESGKVRLPYTSRPSWRQTQSESPDLRRVHAHLTQGTRPSKKASGIKDIKRYLQVVTIASDGLLIVKRDQPFSHSQDRIVVPRSVLSGLLTALHVKLDHPSRHQLKGVTQRYFYALDLDNAITQVTEACHACASLKSLPLPPPQFTTSDEQEVLGISFAADILKRNRQVILVVRECVSAYTIAHLIPDEKSDTVRECLLKALLDLSPLDSPASVVRTDAGPCFKALVSDGLLNKHNISIDIGNVKNINKNPIAEKAIRELEEEMLRQEPGGGPVTSLQLALAVARLNTRLRNFGLSSRELWYQRDQFTNQQLPISDRQVLSSRHNERLRNHPYSERCKTPRNLTTSAPILRVGDIVYLRGDKDKLRGRERYIVVSLDGDWCFIRKFAGSQLRASSYKVRCCDCYVVPSNLPESNVPTDSNTLHDEDDDVIHPPLELVVPPKYGAMLSALSTSFPDNIPVPELTIHPPAACPPDISHGREAQPPPPPQDHPPSKQTLPIPATSPELRRSDRTTTRPKHLSDFVTDF